MAKKANVVPVAAHDRQPPKRKPPFSKSGKGVHAHGVVSELRTHEDGGSVHMTVRHGKPSKNPDGIFTRYPDETRVSMPTAAGQQFRMGQRVRVSVQPHGGSGAKANDNDGDEY